MFVGTINVLFCALRSFSVRSNPCCFTIECRLGGGGGGSHSLTHSRALITIARCLARSLCRPHLMRMRCRTRPFTLLCGSLRSSAIAHIFPVTILIERVRARARMGWRIGEAYRRETDAAAHSFVALTYKACLVNSSFTFSGPQKSPHTFTKH